MNRKTYLGIECVLVFVGIPLAMYVLQTVMKSGIFMMLWALAFGCLYMLSRDAKFEKKGIWRGDMLTRKNLKPMLLRFACCAVAITLFTASMHPEKLFSFPRESPAMWVMVMCFYPLLSGLPQELIYRTFFFHRYRTLLQDGRLMVLASALLFGFAHILFNNWVAVFMTAVGGYLFASTYQKHRSLALVTLEHALYGCFIFTIGLGKYFYHGAVQYH